MITPFITCPKCGICQPLDAYPRQRSTCRRCVAEAQRKYAEKNRDRISDAGRARRAKHREQIAAYVRELQLKEKSQ